MDLIVVFSTCILKIFKFTMHEGKKIGWNLVKVKSNFKYISKMGIRNKLLSFAIVLVLYYFMIVIIRQEIF